MRKKIFVFLFALAAVFCPVAAYGDEQAPEELRQLYAQSAVLMDGDTARVLYEKNGYDFMPMASTTKVMTCMLAIENAPGDDIVRVSSYAASMPDVQLNIREGEEYYLKDLVYSLMLQSHNDSAVAIAEHIGGSVEGFADMMNEKAKAIGCANTHFVTPNGLDASDEGGAHGTTAADLARIMSYAIRNETFLRITQTRNYSFSDVQGTRNYTVHNANALLDMMAGALSGKTGFTNAAGYCYVGAVRQDGKTFIVALLACGWPSHKSYKWSDTRKLISYGLRHYEYREAEKIPDLGAVAVEDGIPTDRGWADTAYVNVRVEKPKESLRILMREDENVRIEKNYAKSLKAPVKRGKKVGNIRYYLGDLLLKEYPVITAGTIEKADYTWCCERVFGKYFHGAL
ncbi:MAG: D-alanyl-D-alanine carboxypeptidase [Lachnospiraceae bacterium]|nr:D-alanyl-D-alanine carboxypeptidase [Lachnospiraceae bacterium]MCI9545626.1 D-alanyl-D-alanine carboxypeptidase [Lachnospiraceae bacterium]